MPSTSVSTSSSSTTSSSSYSTSTSSSVTSTTSTSAAPTTLVVDTSEWPIGDLNQLLAWGDSPYPDVGMYSVYQPLVSANLTSDFATGAIQFLPGLAQNWTVSASGTTYYFNLQPNVTFSNGDPFNSYEVWAEMYGFYYLTGNSSTWLNGFPVFNMSNVDFGPATIALLNQSGLDNPSPQVLAMMSNESWPIYAPNPDQIVFTLNAPFIWFPGTLVSTVGLIFDVNYVLKNGGFGTPTSINTEFNQNPIPGTGPYMFTQVSENEFIKLSQNPTYWGNRLSQEQIAANPALDPGHVPNVLINNRPDDISRYADLSTGAAQIAPIFQTNWNLVTSNPDKFGYTDLPPQTGLALGLALNTQLYPTNITLVRQAIVHAINYSDIFSTVFYNELSPWVGPEYPAWSQFYDLGNFAPYQYNLTLAQQELNEANVTNMPTLTFPVDVNCGFCTASSEIVQADLAQIGINVNLEVLTGSNWCAILCNSYSTEMQNPAELGSISQLAGIVAAPLGLTPADFWIDFVSNTSPIDNQAIYYNPTVQSCVNALTSSANITGLQTICAKAQAQIYSDAAYDWWGVGGLWYGAGSIVYLKSVISGYYLDPTWTGYNQLPLFNTVTFVS